MTNRHRENNSSSLVSHRMQMRLLASHRFCLLNQQMFLLMILNAGPGVVKSPSTSMIAEIMASPCWKLSVVTLYKEFQECPKKIKKKSFREVHTL